jgi:TetR/AcrR family transcriptional repressor of mexJK operon
MHKICSPRSTAKRTAVLDAAQACFLEHGYANTSMDMVAARAGVSKATIYAHFENKDDLFGAIIRRRCDDQSDGLGAMSASDTADARTVLTAMARHVVHMLTAPETLGIFRMVVSEAIRHPDLAKVYYEAGPLRGKALLAQFLDALAARGELRPLDSWRAIDQFIGMLRAEYFHRMLLGLPADEVRASLEGTIDGAVETMMRAYGAKG